MPRNVLPLLAAVLMSACLTRAPAAVDAAARPDQVLVVYNKDWTEDLDGSQPGQDSEEIARYYVLRHTDPRTGLKPYLLGLSSKDPDRPVLNDPVLREPSSDNWLGLTFRGPGTLKCAPWPLTQRGGNALIEAKHLSEGQGLPRYGVAFFRKEDLGEGRLNQLTVKVTPPNGKEITLLDLPASKARANTLTVAPLAEGLLLAVDFARMGLHGAELYASATHTDGKKQEQKGTVAMPKVQNGPLPFVSLGKEGERKVPAASGVLPELQSAPAVLVMVPQGNLGGIRLTKDELAGIDPATLQLSVAPEGEAGQARVIYRGQTPVDGDLVVYRLRDGSLLFGTDFERYGHRVAHVAVTAKGKEGGDFRRDCVLYQLKDFEVSETGPDGVRDDQVYLDNIEGPINEFLESNRTADGVPLKDHILYICVTRGLPLRVASLYGIERGTTSSARRRYDHGAGSALTQRLRMLRYDVRKLPGAWRPVQMVNGRLGRDAVLNIAHAMKACLVGGAYNPYIHPLAHNTRRDAIWKKEKLAGLKRFDPAPFSTELRAAQPTEKFLYGAARIDAPSVEWAKNQIDGALYGAAYLTPRLGPVYYGAYQEGPLAAGMLAERGFETAAIPERADRALLYFGVFGYGALHEEDVGTGSRAQGATSCLWYKGFHPGSMGAAVRSFLGWDMARPPKGQVKLFEQLVRAGITVTAGSSGGSHDTNVTWWDSFVFNHLMLSGYEFGDATLRSCIYLDWTTSFVGDPLYAPDLAKTHPDTTPPQVARAEDIALTARPAGDGTFALEARVKLANTDPEMVETVVECRPKGDAAAPLTGANPRYTAAPHAFVLGLAPETDYEVTLRLVDPYGNAFDSAEAFGPLAVRTGPARAAQVLFETDAPDLPLAIDLPGDSLDEAGEIELRFVAGTGPNAAPQVLRGDGAPMLQPGGSLRVGGAAVDLRQDGKLPLEPGRTYRMVLRWRRFPLTREVVLVARNGAEFILGHTNDLPWNPAAAVGRQLRIAGKAKVTRVRIRDDAPAAPPQRRGPLPHRFDGAAFDEADAP